MGFQLVKDKDEINGLYRARVENRQDPYNRGRVKIRIPRMHGIPDVTEEFIHVEWLPWAEPGIEVGGHDSGSYVVPPTGSWVWVGFEAGDPDKPVYFGGVHHIEGEDGREYVWLEDVIDDESNIPELEDDIPIGNYATDGHEIIKDLRVEQEEDLQEPRRNIVHKSEKGHTIMTDDSDEKETFSIIDRMGQMIKFMSPTLEDEVNKDPDDDSFKRGLKSSDVDSGNYEEEPMSYIPDDEEIYEKAIFFIRDLAGQLFRTVAEHTKERLEMVAHNFYEQEFEGEDVRQVAYEANAGEGNVNYMLLAYDEETENRVYLKADAIEPSFEIVVVEDEEEISRFEMNEEGDIIHRATGEYELQSMEFMRIHCEEEDINISADDATIEVFADEDINIESGDDTNLMAGADSNRESGAEMNNMAGADMNNDAANIHLNSGTASGAGEYGGEEFDYEPPDDDTEWEDELPERFLDDKYE